MALGCLRDNATMTNDNSNRHRHRILSACGGFLFSRKSVARGALHPFFQNAPFPPKSNKTAPAAKPLLACNLYYKRLKCVVGVVVGVCVSTVNSTYVAISVWYSTSPSKVAWRKKGKNQVPTSYITRFAVEFFLSYESLKLRKQRICFLTSYKSTYVAIPTIRQFCHSFCHSAIPSAIPPFRHSAIPPFRHFYYSYV